MSVTLQSMLKSRNLDGRIYLSDVCIYFRLQLPDGSQDSKKAEELREVLETIPIKEMADG